MTTPRLLAVLSAIVFGVGALLVLIGTPTAVVTSALLFIGLCLLALSVA